RAATRSHPSAGTRSLPQQRLRELAIVYLLIAGLMLFWKYVVLRDPEPTQAIPYAVILATLSVIISMLSLPWPLSPSLLRVIELGMIGMVAAFFAFAQYQTMLDFSLRHDLVRAQLVMKNRVLLM